MAVVRATGGNASFPEPDRQYVVVQFHVWSFLAGMLVLVLMMMAGYWVTTKVMGTAPKAQASVTREAPVRQPVPQSQVRPAPLYQAPAEPPPVELSTEQVAPDQAPPTQPMRQGRGPGPTAGPGQGRQPALSAQECNCPPGLSPAQCAEEYRVWVIKK